MSESRRVELCQCPGCGRETPLAGEMALLGESWVITIAFLPYPAEMCPVCGQKPGEPDG